MAIATTTPPQAATRTRMSQVLEDGFFTGMIGAGIVAVWYLVLDLIAGRPLFTPALLGSVLFRGAVDVAAVRVEPQVVAWYSAVHVFVFLGVGFIASWLATQFERFPAFGIALLFLFVLFWTAFFVLAVAVGQIVLGTLGLWTIGVANLLAAAGMTLYLNARHPTALRNLGRIWEEQE
jgi:hypothetical protein